MHYITRGIQNTGLACYAISSMQFLKPLITNLNTECELSRACLDLYDSMSIKFFISRIKNIDSVFEQFYASSTNDSSLFISHILNNIHRNDPCASQKFVLSKSLKCQCTQNKTVRIDYPTYPYNGGDTSIEDLLKLISKPCKCGNVSYVENVPEFLVYIFSRPITLTFIEGREIQIEDKKYRTTLIGVTKVLDNHAICIIRNYRSRHNSWVLFDDSNKYIVESPEFSKIGAVMIKIDYVSNVHKEQRVCENIEEQCKHIVVELHPSVTCLELERMFINYNDKTYIFKKKVDEEGTYQMIPHNHDTLLTR